MPFEIRSRLELELNLELNLELELDLEVELIPTRMSKNTNAPNATRIHVSMPQELSFFVFLFAFR